MLRVSTACCISTSSVCTNSGSRARCAAGKACCLLLFLMARLALKATQQYEPLGLCVGTILNCHAPGHYVLNSLTPPWHAAGYRITACAATHEQAAFVLSLPKQTRLPDETQETLRTTQFPSQHVKVRSWSWGTAQLSQSSRHPAPPATTSRCMCHAGHIQAICHHPDWL